MYTLCLAKVLIYLTSACYKEIEYLPLSFDNSILQGEPHHILFLLLRIIHMMLIKTKLLKAEPNRNHNNKEVIQMR